MREMLEFKRFLFNENFKHKSLICEKEKVRAFAQILTDRISIVERVWRLTFILSLVIHLDKTIPNTRELRFDAAECCQQFWTDSLTEAFLLKHFRSLVIVVEICWGCTLTNNWGFVVGAPWTIVIFAQKLIFLFCQLLQRIRFSFLCAIWTQWQKVNNFNQADDGKS